MGARQPFTPFRPASRTAQHDSNPDSDSKADLFCGDNVISSQPSGKDSFQVLQTVQTESTNQPFNLSGLMPSRNKSLQALKLRKTKTIDGVPQSPANPRSINQQTIQITSPRSSSPNFASDTTGIITVTTFGDHSGLHPAENTARPSHDYTAPNDAYFTFKPDISESPPYPDSLGTRMHSSHSLDKIIEVPEEYEEHTIHREHGFDFNSPYQHSGTILTADPNQRFQNTVTTSFNPETEMPENVSGGHVLRRTSKKRAQQPDEEEDYGLTGVAKRFKGDEDHFSRNSTPGVHRNHNLARAHQSHAVDTLNEESILYRIVGQDVGIRADKKTEQYEAARRRWTECTLEEWTDGAQELSANFTSILGMIKDRMTLKLSAYAGLYTTLDAHKKILEGKNEGLQRVQDSLVKNSGNVVGEAMSGEGT